MPVYNLGQFGQPRESDISGLSEALSSGLKQGAEMRDIKSKEAYYKLQRAQLDNKEKQERLERAEHIATQLTTMDKGKRSQFLLTPAGQETLKEIKKDVPWAFDDGGQFVGVSNEKVVELTSKQRDQQLEGLKVGLAEKLQKGQQLTPEEDRLAQMFKMGGDKMIKEINNAALLEAASTNDFSEENLKRLNNKYTMFYQRKSQEQPAPGVSVNPNTPALSTNFNQQPAQPAVPQGTVPNPATSQKKSFSNLWS